MNDSKEEEILQELRHITKLLALTVTKGQLQKDQIVALSCIGFQPKEIADLLGTTPHTVSVTLSDIKKKAKGRKGRIEKPSEETNSNDKQATS